MHENLTCSCAIAGLHNGSSSHAAMQYLKTGYFKLKGRAGKGLRAKQCSKFPTPLSHAAMHVLNDCHGMSILLVRYRGAI